MLKMSQSIENFTMYFLIVCTLMQPICAANLSQLLKKQHQNHPTSMPPQKQSYSVHSNSPQQSAMQHQQQQERQQQQQQQQQQSNSEQAMHYGDALKNPFNSDEELNDSYHMFNDLKQEPHLPSSSVNFPRNLYNDMQKNSALPHLSLSSQPTISAINYPPNPFENMNLPMPTSIPMPLPMPKFLPFIGYTQPVFIPFPFYIASDMFYSAYGGNNNGLEDVVMSRAANERRPAFQRNSPIYYVRLPSKPYMFVSNISPHSFGHGFSSLLNYQPMPTFSSYGSVFNLPVNFLANGKPTGIYQMGGAPTDIQHNLAQYSTYNGFNTSPPQPSNPYRPQVIDSIDNGNDAYISQQSFGLTSLPQPQQDSKMTSLKRPFVFNGRPEDIYILPNNFNPFYSENSYY